MLQAFAAELAPADLDAQLALQDMTEKRVALLVERVETLSHQLGLDPAGEQAYVDSISRRMWGKPYRDLPERALQQLEGVLSRRLHQPRGSPLCTQATGSVLYGETSHR